MTDESITLTMEEKDKLVQERFGAFVRNLAEETGESPIGAMAVIGWQKEGRTSFAVTLVKAPAVVQMRLADLLSKQFVQGVSKIKAAINAQRS